MSAPLAECWQQSLAITLRPARQQAVEHFRFDQRMIGGNQQPAVVVGRSESLADRSQTDFDAVSHFGRFVIGDDCDRGGALHNFLQRVIVGADDDGNSSDVRPSQRADELLDDRRPLPRQQQLRCAHASATPGGGDQREQSARNIGHVAIRRGNRNHLRRLCLLEGRLAMLNDISRDPHPAALDPKDLLRDCSERRTRRSGPGGQHRNKVETAIVLKHDPTGIEAEANERRSQPENREVALFRLRVRLAIEFRTVRTVDPIPSDLWRSRCRGGRVSVNPSHLDFPTLLAEALDVLALCDFDHAAAANLLGCSGTQLVKLLKEERSAFELLNRERIARGMPRLK